MRRYLRLYLHFLRFSFGRAAQFRVDFFFRIGMDALWYGTYLAFFALLIRQSGSLGGWDASQMRVFAATLFLVDALQMTFFSNNFWQFPFLVNRGDLDYHLVRPVSTLFVVGLRDFAVNSFVNLLMAIGIAIWALRGYPGPLPFTSVLAYVALLGVGIATYFALHLLFLIPIFWSQAAAGLRDVFWTLDTYTGRPIGVFTGWMRRLLVTVLPLGLLVSFPVRVLFEGPRPSIILHMLAAAAGTWVVLLWAWSRGLRAYGSASS